MDNASHLNNQEEKITLRELLKEYINVKRDTWHGEKTEYNVRRGMELHASEILDLYSCDVSGRVLIAFLKEKLTITTEDKLKRVFSTISRLLLLGRTLGYHSNHNPKVLTWSAMMGAVTNPRKAMSNPKNWSEDGEGEHLFEKKHHYALHANLVNSVLSVCEEKKLNSYKALAFIILTATRCSETLDAKWKEFDFTKGEWNIPASRMKMRKRHNVPLTPQMLAILDEMWAQNARSEYVFPNRNGKPYTHENILSLIKKITGDKKATIHGLRATFRTWAALNDFEHRASEDALAHNTKSATEAAYSREEISPARVELMASWNEYCTTKNMEGEISKGSITVKECLRDKATALIIRTQREENAILSTKWEDVDLEKGKLAIRENGRKKIIALTEDEKRIFAESKELSANKESGLVFCYRKNKSLTAHDLMAKRKEIQSYRAVFQKLKQINKLESKVRKFWESYCSDELQTL